MANEYVNIRFWARAAVWQSIYHDPIDPDPIVVPGFGYGEGLYGLTPYGS